MSQKLNLRKLRLGFTLIETLVALLIFSTIAMHVYPMFSDVQYQIKKSANNMTAWTYINSLSVRIGTDIPLQIGEFSGIDNGISWKVAIIPPPNITPNEFNSASIVPLEVSMSASFGKERAMSTATVKTVRLLKENE